MLTPKQIQEMDSLTGLATAAPIPTNNASNRIAELRSLRKEQPQKTSIWEKIGSFTGGTKIAQGLGQAMANKGINKAMDEADETNREIQESLIQRIKEKKSKKEDTTRLEKALAELGFEMEKSAAGREKLLNQKELTGKEVVGDALQLGVTAAGGKVAGKIASKIPGTGTGIVKGALKGAAQAGAGGGVVGAGYGAAAGLKDNKDAMGVVKSAATGGLLGAGTGIVLGGVVGGVSGALKQRALARQEFTKELVAPKQTPTVKEQIIKEGRLTEPGYFRKAKVIPSKKDEQLAKAIEGIVSKEKSIPANVEAIKNKVSDINANVKAYIEGSKVPFNSKTLRANLNMAKADNRLIFASDKTAERTYNAVVDEFMKYVAKKDTKGLFDARQTFDRVPAIKKLLQTEGLGENVRKSIVLDVRRAANEYIADLLPAGNAYKASMLQESRMLEALGNIAEKNTDMIDANMLQLLTKEYPILKWLVGGFATGLVGAAGVGVGSAIINSTD